MSDMDSGIDTAADRGVRAAQRVVARLFGVPALRDFSVRYWNGTVEGGAPSCGSIFTIVLRRPGILRRLLLRPSELKLGEAFVRGDLDIEGDMVAAAALPSLFRKSTLSWSGAAGLMRDLAALPGSRAARPPAIQRSLSRGGRRHSPERDSHAIRAHYDVRNEFYALWLDKRLVYSCGYFQTGAEDIDAAQEAKLDLICRKLRLKPGDRLLDIGCGCGGLLLHAARNHQVNALGVTRSPSQAEFARQGIARHRLWDRCHVEVCNYRFLPPGQTFDKVVSVGMFEHVGASQLPASFRRRSSAPDRVGCS